MDFAFTDEQLAFRDQVLKFSQKEIGPLAEEYDLKGEFCWEAWKKMGEFGLLGLHFPEEFGGSGADVVTSCLAAEALAEGGADGGLTLSWGAHTYLSADTIYQHGTAEQKKKYVPRMATGESVGCMALTEPGAGSDAASIATTAVKKGDRWILNGTKMFITNGPIADVCVCYAVTDKEKKHMGISAFIVEKGFKGFSVSKTLKKMGVKTSTTAELVFEDCEVPEENLLGKLNNGFPMTLQTLEWDRSALLAPFVGGMEFVLKQSSQYAKQRVQFGKPISEFQAVQKKLADIKCFIEAARLLVYRVAWNKDQGKSINHMEAACAKLWVGDWGMPAVSEAVQIHGGYGFMHEYPVERVFRDTKLAQIGGGTSEIQRFIISRLLLA
jgi:butyryl-CoA dehydrogenase